MPNPGETGCSETPLQTHLVRKSSAARRALSICSTTLALSTVAARICKWKGPRSLVQWTALGRPDCSLHRDFAFMLLPESLLLLTSLCHGSLKDNSQWSRFDPGLGYLWSAEWVERALTLDKKPSSSDPVSTTELLQNLRWVSGPRAPYPQRRGVTGLSRPPS